MLQRCLASEKRSGTKSHLAARGWMNLVLWGISAGRGAFGYVFGRKARCMGWSHADWIWGFMRDRD